MPRENHGEPEADGPRHASRIAGLREFHTPSLEAVERRRMQLWFLTTVSLVFVATGVLVLATWTSMGSVVLSAPAMRLGALAIVGIFCAYVVEKEMRLWRVTRMLTDERVLIASLTNRLHEVSLLLETGRALSGLLDLSELLDTVLRSACDLLDANGGSLMVVEGDELVTVSIRGREEALGARIRLGEGVAGHVALRREPILIEGHVDPTEFPGLADRQPYVDSAMSLPLVHADEIVGVLNVNAAAGRAFTEYDLRAVSVFAGQCAAAIANARLFEAERQHVAELIELQQTSAAEAG